MDTEIHHINFGIYSAEEIKRISVCKINNSKLIDEDTQNNIEDNEILLLENYKNNKSNTCCTPSAGAGSLHQSSERTGHGGLFLRPADPRYQRPVHSRHPGFLI